MMEGFWKFIEVDKGNWVAVITGSLFFVPAFFILWVVFGEILKPLTN